MSSPPPPSRPDRARVWLRRLFVPFATVLALALAVFALLPPVARWQIETRLRHLGAQAVSIGSLQLDPANGELTLSGFRSVGPDGREIRIGEGRIHISLSALARRQVTIRFLTLRDADIAIRRQPDGRWSLAGFPMAFGGAEPDGDLGDDDPWQVKATGILIRDSRLTVDAGRRLRIADVDLLRVDDLSTLRPDEPASLILQGRTAESAVRISGSIRPFAKTPAFAADLSVQGLDIGAFDDLVTGGRLRGVAGRISVDGRLRGSLDGANGTELGFSGTASARDFTLDSGLFATRAKRLSWSGDATLRASLPASDPLPAATFRGKAGASDFAFENTISRETLSARSASFDLADRGVVFRPDANDKGEFRIDGAMTAKLEDARFAQPDSGLEIAPKSLTWSGSADIRLPPGSNALFATLSGELSTARFSGAMRAAGIDGLDASDLTLAYRDARIRFDGEGGMNAGGETSFRARGVRIDTPRNGFAMDASEIRSEGLRASLARARSGDLDLRLAGPFAAAALSAKASDRAWQLSQDRLAWNGALGLAGHAGGNARWFAEGTADGGGVRVAFQEGAAEAHIGSLHWSGAAEATTEANSLVVSGESRAADIEGTITLPEAMALRLREASVRDIGIRNGIFGAGEVAIAGFAARPVASSSPLPEAALRTLVLRDPAFAPGRFASVEDLTAKGGELRITRTAEGKIALPGSAASDQMPSADSARQNESQPPSGKPPEDHMGYLKLGRARIGDTQLQFTDRSVSPAFSIRSSRFEATLSDFDGSRPQSRAHVALTLGLDRYGNLQATGTLGASLERIDTDLKIAIRGAELLRFNAYVEKAIGRGIRQGRADGDISLRIADGRIDAETRLALSKVKLQRPRPDENGKESSSSLPIETAIGLLENSDGVMNLSIPITGEFDDPQFDLSNTIAQAMGSVMKQTVVTAAKIAFPLGAIVAIADRLGNPEYKAPPLAFAPGLAALTPDHEARIGEIARFLEKSEDVTPAICGFATGDELDAIRKANPLATEASATALAQQRADAVRNALTAKHGIDPARLYACTPEIDRRNEAKARVSVRF
jgi:outer membrane protein OmpA-like peptidoglycan-associated protein